MALRIDTKVVFKLLNNCFISLPSSFIYPILNSTNLLVQQIILHICNSKSDKHIVSVGWNGLTTQDSNTIEMDTQYASLLKIKEGSTVSIELDLKFIKETITGVRSFATSVEIEPLTVSDWELTEIYAQAIEMNFLSQVRCVRKNQLLLIRANPTSSGSSNSGSITFRVVKIKALNGETDFSTVGNNSELFIIPKPHNNITNKNTQTQGDNLTNGKKKHSVSSKKTSLKSNFIVKRSMINPNGINLTVYNKGPGLSIFKDSEFVQVSVIEGPGTPKQARKVTNKEAEMGLNRNTFGRKIIVRYVELDENDDEEDICETDEMSDIESQSIFLSPLLASCLAIENTCGEIICLEQYNKKSLKLDLSACDLIVRKLTTTSENALTLNSEKKLELKQKEKSEKKLKQLKLNKKLSNELKLKLIDIFGFETPLTNRMRLPIINNILPEGGLLEVIDRQNSKIANTNLAVWVLLNQESEDDETKTSLVDRMKLEIGSDQLVPVSRIQKLNDATKELDIFAQEKKLDQVRGFLNNYVPTFLYGKAGSGKTLFCNVIEKEFKNKGYYTRIIDFNQAGNASTNSSENADENESDIEEDEDSTNENQNGKTDNNKNKFLSNLFIKSLNQCFWHSPSLLILENLDKILPKEVEHSDSGASLQLTELLIRTFDKYVKDKKVTILITAKSKEAINQVIFQRHFVDEEIGLEAPNKHQLIEILHKMTLKKFPDYADNSAANFLSDVTSNLEGYLPLDLQNLLDRVFHNMISEGNKKFEYSNFLSAIEGYTPTSLRGVKLQKSITNWSDIGGLLEVKRILLETLEWPTKYAPIFEKCTLRLRSGILLYGYPGCGKTMLASAISAQCGLNFISVKGPEILNKYIGASEQSVRELFERAQSAKPCILFFDEFDSIAPKRGHDSTGVTDRIVNQLLTQMDGAEGLEGVYVLAATSRPDLIDSALLRPGRLDKSVICDLPDFENRLDILHTIVKSNGFTLFKEGEELIEIAKLTDGYTGADLQAVVYNAYLKGVHENLEAKTSNGSIDDLNVLDDGAKLQFKTIASGNDNRYKSSSATRKKIETLVENYNYKSINKEEVSTTSLSNVEVNEKEKIFIKMDHLMESLSETKKSISAKEFKKLQNIYGQFESSKRPSEMKDGEGSTETGVRTTLM